MANTYQEITDYKLWVDNKFEECKDGEPVKHLYYKAIEENNTEILKFLIYLKYPIQTEDILFCILKNYDKCLNMLLNFFKPDKKQILNFIYESQKNISYECNVALIKMQ